MSCFVQSEGGCRSLQGNPLLWGTQNKAPPLLGCILPSRAGDRMLNARSPVLRMNVPQTVYRVPQFGKEDLTPWLQLDPSSGRQGHPESPGILSPRLHQEDGRGTSYVFLGRNAEVSQLVVSSTRLLVGVFFPLGRAGPAPHLVISACL